MFSDGLGISLATHFQFTFYTYTTLFCQHSTFHMLYIAHNHIFSVPPIFCTAPCYFTPHILHFTLHCTTLLCTLAMHIPVSYLSHCMLSPQLQHHHVHYPFHTPHTSLCCLYLVIFSLSLHTRSHFVLLSIYFTFFAFTLSYLYFFVFILPFDQFTLISLL